MEGGGGAHFPRAQREGRAPGVTSGGLTGKRVDLVWQLPREDAGEERARGDTSRALTSQEAEWGDRCLRQERAIPKGA